jgi:hypothetical protein
MALTFRTASGATFRYVRSNGRAPATELKAAAPTPRERTATVAGGGAYLRIIYGRDTVPGQVALQGFIGTDLVLGVVWGYGEIEEVEKVYINDEDVPAGVTVTHYTGTTSQTADSTLSSAITAFSDDMILRTPDGDVGVAYSVFRIPTGEIDGFPRFQAIIKGRKLYDERTDTTAYSDNSSLCLNDLITHPVYGLGRESLGSDVSADWNDELVEDTFERARLSLTLSRPRKTVEHMRILATYAEVIWYYEGRKVRMSPDKIIDATNASGRNVIQNGEFLDETGYVEDGYVEEVYVAGPVGPFWTKGDGWDIYGGQAICDGSQAAASALSQTVTVEDGEQYGIQLTVDEVTAGSVSLEVGGVEYINESSAGAYTAIFTASGTSLDVEIIGTSDFEGAVSIAAVKSLYWVEDNCVAGSLSVEGVDDGDSPTKVSVKYKEPSATTGYWSDKLTSVALPGVDEGDIPLIDTTLDMPGIYRPSEANTKANQRVQRMVNRVRVSWTTTDHGIRHRLGDVIRHKMDKRGTDTLVKMDAVRMVSYGRYEVSGLRYDQAHYPDELILPENAGVVPVGAITLSAGTIPSGWAAFTDANGLYLLGAGGDYDIGDTGGEETFEGWSGNTTENDAHEFGGFSLFRTPTDIFTGSGSGRFIQNTNPDTDHDHTYDTGTITPDLYRRDAKLMIKTGSAASNWPAEALVMGLGGIAGPGRSRVTSPAGRLLRAWASNGNGGVSSKFVEFVSGITSVLHKHEQDSALTSGYSDDLVGQTLQGASFSALGNHSHTYNLTLNRAIKRLRVALYGGVNEFPVMPGDFCIWAGDINSPPTDWVLCDGSGATPDATDHFIEIAQVGNEETSTGDNTLSISGDGSAVYHGHAGALSQSGTPSTGVAHTDGAGHSHNVSRSADWMPPYYALALLMYSP